jgi:hypothetical protein
MCPRVSSKLVFQVHVKYVITTRISGTTFSRTLPQLVFQVRHFYVRDHNLYFRYDIFTYVITTRISGTTFSLTLSQLVFQVRPVHLRYHGSCFSMTYICMSSQLVCQLRHVHCVIISCTSGTI